MSRSSGGETGGGREVLPFGPFLLFVLPFVTFARFVLGDELANADVFLAYRPVHALLADGLRRGEVPLWTSAFSGGFPLAFSEYGWFSPLVWLPLLALGAHAGYYVAELLSDGTQDYDPHPPLLDAALEAAPGAWFLEVRESNVGAIRLYENAGFRVCGKRPAYYSDPCEAGIVMSREK